MPAMRLDTPAAPVQAAILRLPTDEDPGVLRINGETYEFGALGGDGGDVRAAFKLWPALEDAPYETWETVHGLHGCNCNDFEMRSGPRFGRACKHLAALYAVGLLFRFPPPGCGPAAQPLESVT